MGGPATAPLPDPGEPVYAPAAGPDLKLPGVLERWRPTATPVPVLFDTPHSGRIYPEDFGHAVDRLVLRRAEDAYVDVLIAPARAHGVTLLRALFPRSYIDPNRAEDDIDPAMLDGPWPHALAPSEKSGMGIGLIRRHVTEGEDIYDRLLSVEEVERRISSCHRSYHAALDQTLQDLLEEFGTVWHIDWHSMRHSEDCADMVVGDLGGTSSEPTFRDLVVDTLRALGYRVAVNDPYSGAEVVRRAGAPAQGRHSLQVEISRGLYLDEASVSPSDGFGRLADHLATLAGAVSQYTGERCGTARVAAD